MFTDRQAWSLCRDALEFSADVRRRIRFGVKAVVLRQATRKEHEDDRPGGWARSTRIRGRVA